MKKFLTIMTVFLLIFIAGCGSGGVDNSQVKKSLEEYKRTNAVTYFDIKSLKDDGSLSMQVDQYLSQMKMSSDVLAQISGTVNQVKDSNVKNELTTFLAAAQERDKLTIKYLEDIKQDLNLREKNLETPVDVDRYILRIPQDLQEVEFKVNESLQKLNVLLAGK